jgi:hypothetical protein
MTTFLLREGKNSVLFPHIFQSGYTLVNSEGNSRKTEKANGPVLKKNL